jgi:energy-coupling factor transport system permease protein
VIDRGPNFLSYQAGNSILHRLDPRTKLLCTAALAADALMASVPQGMVVAYALGAVAGLGAIHLLPALWRTLRPLLVLLVLFGVLITIITPGHAFLHIWIIAPSYAGVALAIRLGLQSLLIIYGSSLLTLTTPPLAVAGALEWAFGFLRHVRFPVQDVIAMVAIGLTFVPLLIEETRRVVVAQRARGADLGMAALMDEQALAALLIPLLLANLRRGAELADSMEARLYGIGRRTSLRDWHFQRIDAMAAMIVVAFSAAVVVVSFVLS